MFVMPATGGILQFLKKLKMWKITLKKKIKNNMANFGKLNKNIMNILFYFEYFHIFFLDKAMVDKIFANKK